MKRRGTARNRNRTGKPEWGQALDDLESREVGGLDVRHSFPYFDRADLTEADRQRTILDKSQPMDFGHTLKDPFKEHLRP